MDKSLPCLYYVNKFIFSVEGCLTSEIALYFQNCCTFSRAINIWHKWDKSLLSLYNDNKFMFSVVGYLPPEIAGYFQNCCTFSKARNIWHKWDKSLHCLYYDNKFMFFLYGIFAFWNCSIFFKTAALSVKKETLEIIGTKAFFVFIMIISSCCP